MKFIGVDIGGSHISAAQVKFDNCESEVSFFHESDVNALGSLDEILDTWSSVIKAASESDRNVKIGIAMPGPFDYENGISLISDQGKLRSLYQKSIKNLLAEKLEISSSIVFTNDAEAFLAGESHAGEGREFSNSIGITLGTGLGSAIKVEEIIKDAKLWRAPFREGIAEDFLGTVWFIAEAKRKFGLEISGVKDLLSNEFDPSISAELMQDFGLALGEFLFPYLIRLHSQAVILGGKISLVGERFLPFTRNYLERHDYPIPILTSKLGEKSALIGSVLPFLD